MVKHIEDQMRAQGVVLPAPEGKTPATAAAPRSARVVAQERAACAAVVGVGRLAWENDTFGVPCFMRKYRLLDPAHAAEMDATFHRLTGTQP